MFDLSQLYHPLTATPLGRSSYAEVAPCEALRPYVHCFWYSQPSAMPAALVTPDTCMDLLFLSQNGRYTCRFCPVNDQTFVSTHQNHIAFAIRFYPWAAVLFADEPLNGTLNLGFDSQLHFPSLTPQLLHMLDHTASFAQRCAQAAFILLAHLEKRILPPDFFNAVYAIVHSQGRLRTGELAQFVQLSPRQLERIFLRNAGVSPKKLSDMVRYQQLWREAAFSSHFDIQDAVYRYGYTDQSHLLRQFKQYHSLSLNDALNYARQHVAFLQYNGD